MSRPVCASIVFENWISFAFGVHCITSFQAHCYFKTETGSLELVRKLFGIKWFRLENSIVNRAGDHLSDHGIAEFHEPSSQVMITLRILQYVSFSERFPQLPVILLAIFCSESRILKKICKSSLSSHMLQKGYDLVFDSNV